MPYCIPDLPHRLGEPLPASEHAVSVCLPRWADVIGYEENEPRVMDTLKTGYPRFVYHPITQKLFTEAEKRFAAEDEFCLVLPSARVAALCIAFCGAGKAQPFEEGIVAVVLPKHCEKKAKAFWQHCGYIVSSRRAQAALIHKSTADGNAEKISIQKQLATLSGENIENIYLFPSGMAAIFTAFELHRQKATIQLGFPYVDTLKIQEKFGAECIFINYKSEADLATVETAIITGNVSAVFTEFPCNPLITCIELEKLSRLCRSHNVTLIIDDTLASGVNIDVTLYADIIVSSLTKFFSGIGDVLAGSLILNAKSPSYARLKLALNACYEDLLFGEDAIVLEQNSRDFTVRMQQINQTAEQLYDWLQAASLPLTLYYTKHNPVYETYRKGGYGGIISLVFDRPEQAQKFYDALAVAKGPSLGTNFTLACPYTMLAHYHERTFSDNAGVPFHLIRISVGLEPLEKLREIFAQALKAI